MKSRCGRVRLAEGMRWRWPARGWKDCDEGCFAHVDTDEKTKTAPDVGVTDEQDVT